MSGRTPVPGGIIFQDDHWVVTQHRNPQTDPGELIVRLRRHSESLSELEPAEADTLGGVLRSAVVAVERVVRPERVYVASFGERIRHLHFFILPRTRSLPAGHVLSDLYRNGRNYLRRLGVVSAPTAEARAQAAERLRAEWPRR